METWKKNFRGHSFLYRRKILHMTLYIIQKLYNIIYKICFIYLYNNVYTHTYIDIVLYEYIYIYIHIYFIPSLKSI